MWFLVIMMLLQTQPRYVTYHINTFWVSLNWQMQPVFSSRLKADCIYFYIINTLVT